MSEYVYALELDNNKFYIGKSSDVPKRFGEHKSRICYLIKYD